MNIFALVGRAVLTFLAMAGRLGIFTGRAVTHCVSPPIYWSLLLKQMFRIGWLSLPVVGLTAFFTGGVLALQIYIGSYRYGAEAFVPQVVALGICRELGPVIAGLMFAGLVAPRMLAAVITMPLLVGVADIIGIFGGYSVSTSSLGFNGYVYLNNSVNFLTNQDVFSGLIKAAAFGFIVSLMGCYHGFNSKGGAQGVGAATTDAVTSSMILILAANYILTSLLFET